MPRATKIGLMAGVFWVGFIVFLNWVIEPPERVAVDHSPEHQWFCKLAETQGKHLTCSD